MQYVTIGQTVEDCRRRMLKRFNLDGDVTAPLRMYVGGRLLIEARSRECNRGIRTIFYMSRSEAISE